MIIKLNELRDGSHRQSWNGVMDGIDLLYPDEGAAGVTVDAQIHRLRDLITVRGDIHAETMRPCDRCLKRVSVPLDAPLHVVIRQRTVSTEIEEGDEGEFIVTISDEEPEIDITELIRDRLIVEMPMVVHCSPDCRGLCPQCGVNLNETDCGCTTDANLRWEALRSVQADDQ